MGGHGRLGRLGPQIGTGLGHTAIVKSRGPAVVTDYGEIWSKFEYVIVWARSSPSDQDHLLPATDHDRHSGPPVSDP
jgi:hypothetical protein